MAPVICRPTLETFAQEPVELRVVIYMHLPQAEVWVTEVAGGGGMRSRLNDLVGSDIGLHVGKNFFDSFPERVYPGQLIKLMNEAKRLGEKSGAGFYKFAGRGKASPDPQGIAPILADSRKVAPSF